MLHAVRVALGRPLGGHTVRECRHCGTSLRRRATECPACESTEIATYRL